MGIWSLSLELPCAFCRDEAGLLSFRVYNYSLPFIFDEGGYEFNSSIIARIHVHL
jgi:hypothetical protein